MVRLYRRPLRIALASFCALAWVSTSWGQNISEQDFTADYWPSTSTNATCPTGFKALPAPRFAPKTEAQGKSVVRSDQYRERDSGDRQFTGNVKVQTDDLLLTAPELEWLEQGPLEFEHGLALYHEQGAMAIENASLTLDSPNPNAEFSDFSFVLFDFPLQGRLGSLTGDETEIEANGLSLSGCDPRAESWGFRIKRIRINRETTRVKVNGVGFYVGRLPIFYIPYFTFRVDPDRSGFTDNTTFGYRSDNGVIISQPFRLPHQHGSVEFTPRLLSKNGGQITSSLDLHGFVSVVDWVPDDRLRNNASNESVIDSNRWRVKANYAEAWGDLHANIDFTQTSDFAYQHDFEFDSLSEPNFSTNNTAGLNYTTRDWALDLSAQRFNSTSSDLLLGERVPELDLRWQPRWGAINAMSHLNTASYRTATNNLGRLHFEQHLNAEVRQPWGELTLGSARSQTKFALDEEGSTDLTRDSDSIHATAGLNFDRWTSSHLLTLEPRLHYIRRSVSGFTDLVPLDQPRRTLLSAQLFADPRISGLDYLQADDRLSAGMRLRALPHSDSRSVLQASLARITLFEDSDHRSGANHGVGLSLSFKNPKGFLIEHRRIQDMETRADNENSTLMVFEPAPSKSLYTSFGKRERDAIDQAEFGFRWPLSPRWQVMGAAAFDWQEDNITGAHLGFTYTGCCFRTTLLFQRAIDWDFMGNQYEVGLDNRVMLRFDLSGLGTIGEKRIETLNNRKRFDFH